MERNNLIMPIVEDFRPNYKIKKQQEENYRIEQYIRLAEKREKERSRESRYEEKERKIRGFCLAVISVLLFLSPNLVNLI